MYILHLLKASKLNNKSENWVDHLLRDCIIELSFLNEGEEDKEKKCNFYGTKCLCPYISV